MQKDIRRKTGGYLFVSGGRAAGQIKSGGDDPRRLRESVLNHKTADEFKDVAVAGGQRVGKALSVAAPQAEKNASRLFCVSSSALDGPSL